MIFRALSFIFLAVITISLSHSELRAQDQEAPAAEENQDFNETIDIIDSVSRGTVDEYVLPTIENLSRLYWAIGKLDVDDDEAIDNFLIINECPMYLQYYHNDFEWAKIREATRDHIMTNLNEYATKFEILTAVELGRYDLEGEYFEIADNSKITGLRRLDFSLNDESYRETCGKRGEIDGYPYNMVVILNRPLTLEKIPVKRELAELYIEEAKRFYENLPLMNQHQRYKRLAFLRLKVWVTQYKNTMRTQNGYPRAVVFGRLEGYEFYADSQKIKPLYFKELKTGRFSRLKKIEKKEPEQQAQPEVEQQPQRPRVPGSSNN